MPETSVTCLLQHYSIYLQPWSTLLTLESYCRAAGFGTVFRTVMNITVAPTLANLWSHLKTQLFAFFFLLNHNSAPAVLDGFWLNAEPAFAIQLELPIFVWLLIVCWFLHARLSMCNVMYTCIWYVCVYLYMAWSEPQVLWPNHWMHCFRFLYNILTVFVVYHHQIVLCHVIDSLNVSFHFILFVYSIRRRYATGKR